MLIERLVVHERKRVVLIVPKAARYDVWERDIRRCLGYLGGDFSNLVVFNHTDLLRGGGFADRFERVKEMADVIVIDEAHHFRNPGLKGEPGEIKSRYWRLYDIAEGKTIYFLTATPVNNRLIDFQHMIELFSRRDRPDYFKRAPLGIHSLSGHFRKLEKALEKMVWDNNPKGEGVDLATNEAEAEQVLWSDDLFRALVVQRSRAYVKKSQEQHGGVKGHLSQAGAPARGRLSTPQDLRPSARHGGKGLCQRKAALLPGRLLSPGLLHRTGYGKTAKGLDGKPSEGRCQPDPGSCF